MSDLNKNFYKYLFRTEKGSDKTDDIEFYYDYYQNKNIFQSIAF